MDQCWKNFLPTICFVAFSIVLSLPIASGLVQDDDEEEGIRPMCVQVGPFEDKIEATMQNRIQQLKAEIELSPAQVRKLNVASKGVMKSQASYHNGWFFFGNPTASEFWKKTMGRTLDETQKKNVKEFDAKVDRRIKDKKRKFNELGSNAANAELVAAHLQKHLYLTDEQVAQVELELTQFLEETEGEAWDPTLSNFYEAKKGELDQALTAPQLLFFDGESLKNGIGDGPFWGGDWRKAKCTDCHVR